MQPLKALIAEADAELRAIHYLDILPTPVREGFWLYSAAAKYCSSSAWQRSEGYLLRLFVVLPPDAVAFVACSVAIWVCEWRI
jgi:hypothetical protein